MVAPCTLENRRAGKRPRRSSSEISAWIWYFGLTESSMVRTSSGVQCRFGAHRSAGALAARPSRASSSTRALTIVDSTVCGVSALVRV